MTELITLHQANQIMLAILLAAPIVGVIWGALQRQLVRGLVYGLIVGGGNFVMWTVYNAITDQLGLDTVKNLLVNLGLFIAVGLAAGFAIGRYNSRPAHDKSAEKAD